MSEIKGDIVKRFMMRGKFVIIAKLEVKDQEMFSFRVADKCNKKDYFSNERYTTFEDCERASIIICKGV